MANRESEKLNLNPEQVVDFQNVLKNSNRIIAILGAGISVASGLSTFRNTSGLCNGQDAMLVASPAGFRRDPGLVWQFYSFRRHEALMARPNAAHFALAELAHRVPGFMTLTQNVDNLSTRAGHPSSQHKELHGSLFDIRCIDKLGCGYIEHGNLENPLTPALDVTRDEATVLGHIDPDCKPKANLLLLEAIARKNAQILGHEFENKGPSASDLSPLKAAKAENKGQQLKALSMSTSDIRLSLGLIKEDLPQCPKCAANILRPGVVWFGEELEEKAVQEAESLFDEEAGPIDLCLVIGTSSKVWPVAGYAALASKQGARIATINLDPSDAKNVRPNKDWVFVGDASAVVPKLLKPITGDSQIWMK
ncbi:NAD-dependent protein deacylase [Paramyrothecium foliicola]|nr:NAD-dependent protein deacylase [Paramyrothecium foliicola]